MTKQVLAGKVAIGGGAPVTVQTMTNTDTRDVAATLAQIRAMADAGADIVRVFCL
jgi:Enzyme involved in the deoxyxylulose pathway of isoprenoid biosynthesis